MRQFQWVIITARVRSTTGGCVFTGMYLSTGRGELPLASGPWSSPGYPLASGPSWRCLLILSLVLAKVLSQVLPGGGGGPQPGWGSPPGQDRRASAVMPWAVSLLRSRRRTFLLQTVLKDVNSSKSCCRFC